MKLDPTSPEAWLLRARSNLRRAILGPQHPEVVLEDLVFDAQQAAEKALKAVCLHKGLAFPKTHSLVLLMDLVQATGIAIPPEVKEADVLTQYAVSTRYPGPDEELTLAEYQIAVDLATRLVQWAHGVIQEAR
jgi:HEPN domain-containing protein